MWEEESRIAELKDLETRVNNAVGAKSEGEAARFKQLVAEGKIHYFIASGGGFGVCASWLIWSIIVLTSTTDRK